MDPNVKYQVATLLGVGGLGGVFAYWLRSRVDRAARQDNAVMDAQTEPVKILKDELAKREKELNELREADQKERVQYIATLGSIQKSMEAMATDLHALREEERVGRAKLYERVDQVDDRLLVIETRLEKRNGSA